jgi:hypothetical protein
MLATVWSKVLLATMQFDDVETVRNEAIVATK